MLNINRPLVWMGMGKTIRARFGVGKLILHYIRTVMNRIRWEENRELHSLQARNPNLPRTTEQANKLFVATQQDISMSELARMQRIDRILGTRTFFHQTKPYQERLDSDHIMDLEQLKRSNRQVSRKTLDWLNPQVDVKVRYKNKRKYYSYISKLRTYPKHDNVGDFSDEKKEDLIKFLGKEAVYSKISLKGVELSVESMEKEAIGLGNQRPFQGEKYTYFRPSFSMQLFRIEKKLYTAELVTDQKSFLQKQHYIKEVISLDQIYETLKEYDLDERVSEYLKKLQNNRLEYLFSQFTYDANENVVAVMIDLLGTMKEYCLLVKSMTADSGQKMRPIFNVRPQAIFSADGEHICYVQRSPQGGWIELAYRAVQSCWQRKGELALLEDSQEVLFRCGAEKELRLGTDSRKNYIFLTIQEYGKEYSESLFIVQKREEEGLSLIQLDSGHKCQYYYDISPLGVIFARFQAATDPLKHGQAAKVADSVQLVPYKQHLQVVAEQKIGISDGFLPASEKRQVVPASEFDIANKKTIYTVGQGQFIREIQTRSTHLIIVLNISYVYDRAILYLLPFKPTAHPHSLILSGGTNLTLRSHTHTYNSQIVQFSKPVGCLFVQKSYNIWKKELVDVCDSLKRYHYERILISNQGEYPLQISLLCRNLYSQVAGLPVVIYFPSGNEELEGTALRQLLEKGVLVVQFEGRGTMSRDAQHYLSGCRQNFPNLMDDLQAVIEFIGNGMSKNISLYCKGESSSLVGLWFNVFFPYLFNATVLHNGIYDLQKQESNNTTLDFFGSLKDSKGWQAFNIYKHKFKQPTLPSQAQTSRQIGTLENIIFSSDKTHRPQSRKLIHRLRQNPSFSYQQLYLKQYENQYETDLQNLAYLYSKIRTRLQTQQNTPTQQQP